MERTRLTFLTEEENRTWQEIPGWLLPSAAELLYQHASQANLQGAVVEIGTFAGKSLVCIARAVKDTRPEISRVVAIDPQFQPEFRETLNDFGVSALIRCLEMPSLAAADTWRQPISFLYIDGHHGKAHAYADLVVWDTMVIPGGIVALDDTIGFFVGPNLQVQVATLTGAYELLTEVGGVTFLKKKQALFPLISVFPLSKGSLIAYVQYVGAWLGAMDPAFRLPQRPQARITGNSVRRLLSNLWNASPRQVAHYIATKSVFHKDEEASIRDRTLQEPQRLLEWLQTEHNLDEATATTLAYFGACLKMRLSRADSAIEELRRLCGLDTSVQFPHYKISIREMAMLRLAQAYDLRGTRNLAKETYVSVIQESPIPELRHSAELGLSTPFQLPALTRKTLLREYNLELDKYQDTFSQANFSTRAPIVPLRFNVECKSLARL